MEAEPGFRVLVWVCVWLPSSSSLARWPLCRPVRKKAGGALPPEAGGPGPAGLPQEPCTVLGGGVAGTDWRPLEVLDGPDRFPRPAMLSGVAGVPGPLWPGGCVWFW